MSDLFTTIVRSPVARRVGVPQPTRLRRYEPGMPLCEGPVLVAGDGRFADGIAAWLGGAGVPAVSTLPGEGEKVGAVVLDLSAATDPAELDQLRLLGAPAVKALKRNGRVVVVGTDPTTLTYVAAVTTQGGHVGQLTLLPSVV